MIALSVLVVAALTLTTDDKYKLTLVPDDGGGAACLDGTLPGYWMRTMSLADSNSSWIIHFVGGGWW